MNENPNSEIPLDLNKIYTDLAEKLITSTATSIFGKGKSLLQRVGNDFKLKLESSYKDYLACVYVRFSKAKSFLIRDESTQLYDFYIPQGISCGTKKVEEASIFNFSVNSRFAVIKGSAGSGKSMMMRHLFLNSIEKQEKVPVFVELRRINDFDGSLLEFIKTNLTENKFTLDNDYIEKALKAGHFAIFLDGFDEIATSKRKQLIKEVNRLAQDYDKNIVIVSSRPDDEFSSWNHLNIWEITPLNLPQALKLIRKVPSKNIDRETRDKFLKDLENFLFVNHSSFLSNPLLLSIMVITYANSGDVPQKISTFYENAYIALFERHDALKGAFKRDRNCNLDILEFKKIFSAFSAVTSSNLLNDSNTLKINSLRFPKTDALNFVNIAKEISDLVNDFDSEDFLQDCIKAVCLLIEDGLEITFAHRSFQEYFTAIFISNLDDVEAQTELIASYFLDSGNKTTDILYEINASLVEKLFLIPCVEKLEKAIKFDKHLTLENYINFLRYCFFEIRIDIKETRDHKGVGVYILPTQEQYGQIMAYAYILFIDNYTSKNKRFLNFSPENEEKLKLLLNGKTITEGSFSTKKLTKSSKLLQIYAKDESWGFSVNNLKLLLETKNRLVEKHKQINIARKENLLKGLRKKSKLI